MQASVMRRPTVISMITRKQELSPQNVNELQVVLCAVCRIPMIRKLPTSAKRKMMPAQRTRLVMLVWNFRPQ